MRGIDEEFERTFGVRRFDYYVTNRGLDFVKVFSADPDATERFIIDDLPWRKPSRPWTREQAISYLEAAIRGVCVGIFIFRQIPRMSITDVMRGGMDLDFHTYYEVLDGRERIMAWRAFFAGHLPILGYNFAEAEQQFQMVLGGIHALHMVEIKAEDLPEDEARLLRKLYEPLSIGQG